MPVEIRTNQLTPDEWTIVDLFHQILWNQGQGTTWLGIPVLKLPLDLFNYQHLISSIQPDTLIECGTALGGSALFFASIMDLIGKGQVITIDAEPNVEKLYRQVCGDEYPEVIGRERPKHHRITYLTGNTEAPSILRKVKQLTHGTTMVVLDSDHDAHHVLRECRLYAPFVTNGSYLVIEDVNFNGHPINAYMGQPGPYEAAIEFLHKNHHFKWNVGLMEHYLLSYNAWLLRQD